MRIIAGTFKGRILRSPSWDGVRPTSDALRETIFNVLGPSVVDASVLDGCAGTGAIGLEALSRGARHVTFVDDDARAVALVRENVTHCGCENRCAIIRGTVQAVLSKAVVGEPFEIVVLDPPYDAPWRDDAVRLAAAHLAPHGRLVLEHAWRVPPPADPALTLVRTRRAGDSALTVYRRRAAEAEETAST